MNHTLGPVPPRLEDFSWETLRSFLDGVSPIDLETLSIANRDEAIQFLVHYGYDLSIPDEIAEAKEVEREALQYLKEHLCPAPTQQDRELVVPAEELAQVDLPDLLVTASDRVHPLQKWACAMLRVMHTISHANHAIRSSFYEQIKEQILERYRAHLFTDDSGQPTLGRGEEAVPLVSWSFREEKSRESLILKLLHKPDNVAQSVFDRIGIRFVTENAFDALMLLRYLRRNNLTIFANIMPGRSKNNLLDLQVFRAAYEDCQHLPEDEAIAQLRSQRFLPPSSSGETNPHSSPLFRSIQFTCRQLIRILNPVTAVRRRLPPELDPELLSPLDGFGQEVLRFFFPYELQLMDRDNFQRTQTGDGSHANYRIRQLRTARRRVLGSLLHEG